MLSTTSYGPYVVTQLMFKGAIDRFLFEAEHHVKIMKDIHEKKYKRQLSCLLPFGNDITIGIPLIQAKLIQFTGNLFPTMVKIEDVATFLVCNFEDRPHGLTFSLPIMWIIFSCSFNKRS